MVNVRRPVYLNRDQPRQDRWLVSYTDVVTILLVLFIAAAAHMAARKPDSRPASKASAAESPAVSNANKPETTRTGTALPVSIEPQDPLNPPVNAPTRGVEPVTLSPALVALQTRLRSRNADLRIESAGIVISLPQAILFPPGQARIQSSALPLVEEIAGVIRGIPNRISLIGHSDRTPIRNKRFESNWQLSTARSLKLLDLLTAEFGIPEDRLSIASFGSHQPKTTNETPEGRAANRRVEIVILPESASPTASR